MHVAVLQSLCEGCFAVVLVGSTMTNIDLKAELQADLQPGLQQEQHHPDAAIVHHAEWQTLSFLLHNFACRRS